MQYALFYGVGEPLRALHSGREASRAGSADPGRRARLERILSTIKRRGIMKETYGIVDGQIIKKTSWNTWNTERIKIKRTIFILFPALILLTIASIYIVYGKNSFFKWSWLQSSIIISLFTCMWPYVVRQSWENVWGDFSENRAGTSLLYAFFLIPFEILLIYPGLNRLGVSSDGKLSILIFTLAIIHGIGFYVVFLGLKNIPE